MADSKSIVTLNIGSQRISMAVFDVGKSGNLTLQKYDSTAILADPAAEMVRLPQIQVALTELTDKLEIKKSTQLRYAISGQSVFTRFIKLPPIEEENIHQLVEFEAQQHVPFPIDEVIWDWQLLESDAGEKEVALVAIKGESLNDINDVVVDSGMGTIDVDAAPMALYNALKYNYPDLEGAALLIDIGAKTCNLIYLEGNRMFTRSVAVGGASVTTAIAKEYGILFSEAESQKCVNGLVALNTVHTSEMDDVTAALATVIRNAISKLPAEIARTTNYFRSQHGGKAPQRVFLAGGGANLPYLGEFFQDKLQLPVEFFNPLRRISMGNEIDADRVAAEAHTMGELVGLALRSTEETALMIDLVPEQVMRERKINRRKPWLLASSAVLIVGLGLWGWTNMSRKEEATLEVKKIADEVAERKRYARPLDNLAKKEAELDAVANQLTAEIEARSLWINMWDDLAMHFASDVVWLVDFDAVIGFKSEEVTGGSSGNVQSVIGSDFSKTSYGVSALKKLVLPKTDAAAQAPRGRRAAPAVEPGPPPINAVKVTGFWRGKEGYREVRNLIDRLRNGSKYFDVLATEKTIISLPTTLVGDAYATQFEIILPLKKPISTSFGAGNAR